jgi:hypothetical protein
MTERNSREEERNQILENREVRKRLVRRGAAIRKDVKNEG